MTATVEFFQIAGFKEQQHYSDRRLLWIKLHNDLLDRPAFCMLTPFLRYVLIGLMLLASRCDNRIPYDVKYLSHALHVDEELNLRPLFDAGFLLAHRKRSSSKTLAPRKPNACLEKDREKEKDNSSSVVSFSRLSDTEWLDSLKGNPAYQHLNIDSEWEKAKAWMSVHPGRKFTRKFFINWLNRAQASTVSKPNGGYHSHFATLLHDLAQAEGVPQ